MESHQFEGFPISFSALEELTGLPSSSVAGLLAEYGEYGSDIGTARTETVHALIRGMRKVDPDLTPTDLIKMFEIELPRYQKRWLLYAPDEGSSEYETPGHRLQLLVPLVGHIFAPSGWWVEYLPDEPGEPGLWKQNDVHWVLPSGVALLDGRRLGKFLSVGPH